MAAAQLDADAAEASTQSAAATGTTATTYVPAPSNGSVHEGGASGSVVSAPSAPTKPQYTRFHGTKALDATRLVRDADEIAKEVIQHLSRLVGAEVEVTLEIHARLPEGASEETIRTVTENCRTLNFRGFGFEEG